MFGPRTESFNCAATLQELYGTMGAATRNLSAVVHYNERP